MRDETTPRTARGKPFCYGRDCDVDHLRAHGQQVTTSIRLFRGPTEIERYGAILLANPKSGLPIVDMRTLEGKASRGRTTRSSG